MADLLADAGLLVRDGGRFRNAPDAEAFRAGRGLRPRLDKTQTEAYESAIALVAADTAAGGDLYQVDEVADWLGATGWRFAGPRELPPLSGAETVVRAALGEFPDDADLLTMLGYVLRMQGRHVRALAACDAAVAAAPEYGTAHAQRASTGRHSPHRAGHHRCA